MEQIHSRALEALQPFVVLATTSASPSARFVANLITNATSSPSTFVFAELLETPAVQGLAAPETPEEYRGYLQLLQIFAWGTWEEYCSTPGLPALNDAQSQKLRLLSLLTLSTIHNPLTYPIVMKSLSLESHAQLESLVTQAIYSSLIAARLSPTSSPPIVRVTSVAPLRDVRLEAVNSMISILAEWQDRCNNVINGIEAEIQTIRADAQKKQLRERDRASLVQKLLDGDNEGGEGGAGESGNQSNTKRFLRSMMESSFGGGGGGGGRRGQQGGGFSTGNKREYNATRDGLPLYALGDKGMELYSMEIDEGFSGDPTRHSKRILGMGTR